MVFIPGVAVSSALRLRGFIALAVAPLSSTAVVGVFGVVAHWLGVPWSVAVYAGAAAVSALVGLALTHRTRIRDPRAEPETSVRDTKRRHFAWQGTGLPLAAAGLGGVVIMRRLTKLIGEPDHLSQVIDNIFHLNAVRYVIDSGNASSLTLGGSQRVESFYPASWHSFTAMTAQLTGAPIQVAENSVNLIVAAVVWPLGCVLLARALLGSSAVVTLAAGILASAQTAFPYLLYVWGPLFPNALSVSLIPAAITITVSLLGAAARDADRQPRRTWVLAFGCALAGIATAQTSAVTALSLFVMPLVVSMLVRRWRGAVAIRRSSREMVASTLLTVSTVVVGSVVWLALRPPDFVGWGPHASTSGAVREALTNAPLGTNANWLVTPLAWYGVVVLLRSPRRRWFVASYGIAVLLYVVDAAMSRGAFRDFLTGTWYGDTYRLAAFLPIFATVTAAAGARDAVDRIRAAYRQRHPLLPHLDYGHSPSVIGSMVLIVFGATYLAYMGPPRMYLAQSYFAYRFDGESALLTPDELDFLESLPRFVEPGAVIAGNPWNGSSLAYAFGRRQVLTPHLSSIADDDATLLNEELGKGEFTPEVCVAVAHEHVRYILDFGHDYILDEKPANQFRGVTDVRPVAGIELVATHRPTLRLFRVTGCDH